jgi:hypothetical protein
MVNLTTRLVIWTVQVEADDLERFVSLLNDGAEAPRQDNSDVIGENHGKSKSPA